MSVLESHDSNLNGTKLTKITTSKHKKKNQIEVASAALDGVLQ